MANDKYDSEKFEQYSVQLGYSDFEASTDGHDSYRNPNTQGRWNFWRASRDALALTAPVATEQAQAVALNRESLIDLIEDNLHAVYHCTRVWSAWGVGTMSEDDFHEARGSDLAPDLADAIIAMLAASPGAAPAAMVGATLFAQNALPPSYDGSTLLTRRDGTAGVTFEFRDAEQAEVWHDTITARYEAAHSTKGGV